MLKLFYFSLFLLFVGNLYAVDKECFSRLSLTRLKNVSVCVKAVGQGSGTIVHNHENDYHLVVDLGSSSDAPAGLGGGLSEEFGFSETANDMPFANDSIVVITSHSDQDHINLFKEVFGLNQSLLNRVGKVILGDYFGNYFRLNTEGKPVQETRDFIKDFILRVPNYQSKLLSLSHENVEHLNFMQMLSDLNVEVLGYQGFIPRYSVPRKCFFEDDQPGEIEFLGINPGQEPSKIKDTNANSAVVRLLINGHNILIMGDATGYTTDRILGSITDPSILKADLLIASHHGADNEDANHITWAAVTSPKCVTISHGFNSGYGHPTLTAVANFMVTGVSEERESLPHVLSVNIFNQRVTELKGKERKEIWDRKGPLLLNLRPSIFGLSLIGLDVDHEGWFLYSTSKPIYGTGTSGDLTYVISKDGQLMDFKREY